MAICEFCKKDIPRNLKGHIRCCSERPEIKRYVDSQPVNVTKDNWTELNSLPVTIRKKLNITYKCSRCQKSIIVKLIDQSQYELCPSCRQAETARKNNLEKYGVTNVMQIKEVFEKNRATCKERYGVDRPCQNPDIHSKMDRTCIERYGYIRPNQNVEIQNKIKETVKERYGVENVSSLNIVQLKRRLSWDKRTPEQKQEVFEKRQKTLTEKFGENFQKIFSKVSQQTKQDRYGDFKYNNRDKIIETKLKRYGTLCMQSCRYKYDDMSFDSKPELIFYIYMKEHGYDIHRNKKIYFEYLFENKVHRYFPDFIVSSDLYEIKGGHFRSEGTWCNPFDNKLNPLSEAKHRCAQSNNVHILYDDLDFDIYNDYINNKYPKDYLERFRKLNP